MTSSEILAGQEGLEREFSKFSIGAMTEQNILSYLHDGGLLIVGDRTRIQLLALEMKMQFWLQVDFRSMMMYLNWPIKKEFLF